MIRRLIKKIELWFNNLAIKKKMVGLFVVCVIVPLVITDSFILYTVDAKDKAEQMQIEKEVADSIQAQMNDFIRYSDTLSNGISRNSRVNAFLSYKYANPLEYYLEYTDILSNSFFESMTGFENTKIMLYADNETLINGGHVAKIKSVMNASWCKDFRESDKDISIMFVFDNWENKNSEPNRKIFYMKRMTGGYKQCEKFMRVEIDYSTTSRKFREQIYDRGVYLCKDDKILFSNEMANNLNEDFYTFDKHDEASYVKSFELYGDVYQIYVMKRPSTMGDFFERNAFLFVIIIAFSVLLPAIFIVVFNYSIVTRLQKVEQAFKNAEDENLQLIEEIEGKDEIGSLMLNYNVMADRINELIQIVYKNKLIEHENNIARKNAELLALHSQINPHFLFNALESIRMHSIIRSEEETAEMVAKLALLERQYVEWGEDLIEVSKEMKFVEAYLGLQKYRFGDRLMYNLEVADDCLEVKIPKLTVVTFVENACVHGIESKSSTGWVFVRIFKEDGRLCIDIEDTGGGIDESVVEEMVKNGKEVTIEKIKGKKHVGIYNALLRLKIFTDNKSEFTVESERGVGTLVQIKI